MGQQEVMDVLQEATEPLGRLEIAEAMDGEVDPARVSKCLQRLLRHNEIKCIEISQAQAMKREIYLKNGLKAKRRMRLYYI